MQRSNAQGLVIAPYKYRRSCHLFFRVGTTSEIREFLRGIFPRLVFGDLSSDQLPEWFANIGITDAGLAKAGCPAELRSTLDPHFRDGPDPLTMGDSPGSPSRASQWWDGQWSTGEIDLTVQVYAREKADIETGIQAIEKLALAHGLEALLPRSKPDHEGSRHLNCMALPRASGDTLAGSKLHFGYRDGLSRLDVAWDGPVQGQMDPAHFVLGYSSPEVTSSPAAEPAAGYFRDSSYMVLRWLQQDVHAFEKFLTEAAPALAPERPSAEGREYVAAKLMGRWRDGTPLVLSPETPNPSLATSDFNYHQSDPSGFACPFSAHVRVVNPRDQPLKSSEPFATPSVIRRGMPYGPEWPEGQESDDGIDRGIVGLFLCTSIARQFYILMQWISQTDFSPAFKTARSHDQDSLFGNRSFERASKKWHVPRPQGDHLQAGLPDFIHTRGTAFFLLPSKSLLEELCK
jgi:hypothetical protein